MELKKLLVIYIVMVGVARCDLEKDKERCANIVAGMATCLPYVSGQSTAPPMDCCTGFKLVVQQSPACICLLIKDRNDPSLGLKINATLALGLPIKCNTHANQTINDCPSILHLPPNSPDAKVFEDFANGGKKSNATAPSSAADHGHSSSTGMITSTGEQQGSNDGGRRNISLETEMILGILLAMLAVLQILPSNL